MSRHYTLGKTLILDFANGEFDVTVLDGDAFQAQAG